MLMVTPKTIASLVEEFLDTRPHLRKSNAKGGAGAGGSSAKGVASKVIVGNFTKEQLSDPKFFQDNFVAITEAIKRGSIKI